jgi:hypothetical protein
MGNKSLYSCTEVVIEFEFAGELPHPRWNFGDRKPLVRDFTVSTHVAHLIIRSICNDPELYPDPEIFKLNRHIDSQGHLRNDNQPCQFGFGRR